MQPASPLFVKEGTFLGPPLFPLPIGGRPIPLDVFPPPLHFPFSRSLPGQFRKKLLFSPLQRGRGGGEREDIEGVGTGRIRLCYNNRHFF